ncbi:MAG: type II secretion system secretin GspD [Myxococcales bacterium]|nr:type II secretion system secretin GspD [Myxococcales bacterium]
MQRLALVTLIVILGSSAIASADEVEDPELYRCKSRSAEVSMTFKPEMELKDLVTWAIGLTCKPFMLDPRIVSTGKKVTLIAPAKMSTAEGYKMFLAALATVGLTVVPKGKGFRIVDAPTARTQALPIYSKTLPDDADQVVRYVVRPTYTKAETLQKTFSSIKSEAGDVQIVGSLVLVTDYGSQVRSMMTLAKLIDVPEGTDAIYTIPVHHADAKQLVTELETILGLTATAGKAEAASSSVAVPSKLLVDARTNTVIVAATEVAYHRVQALIERLDVALDIEGGATIHVYKLSHAIAADLAGVLTQTIQGATAKSTPSASSAGGSAPARAGEGDGPRVDGEVRVIAEKGANALIVMSSGRDFLAIKDIIRQLDEPRRQVYIEGVIAEVQISDDLETGVSAHGFLPVGSGSSVLVGGVQTGTVSSTNTESLAGASGLVAGVLSSATSSYLGTSIPSYGLLFTALATKTNSNVLAEPSMLAVDNEVTSYKIGTNIPYKRGLTYGGLAGTSQAGSTTVNIDRMDLELKLDIKPHISEDGTVLLEIEHDAKDLGDSGGELGPTWNTRTLHTRVVVHDQQTVVIGGMLSQKEYVVHTQIPILGDIPLLGRLFRHSLKQKRKSNLVILLTPYILKDGLDIEAIRERRMQQHGEFVRSFTSLDGMKYQPRVDYRHKRGLVEEINRAVQTVEDDTQVLEKLQRPPTVKAGAID